MKNKILLFLVGLAYSVCASAQFTLNAENTKSLYQQSSDSLFQYLDKTPIHKLFLVVANFHYQLH